MDKEGKKEAVRAELTRLLHELNEERAEILGTLYGKGSTQKIERYLNEDPVQAFPELLEKYHSLYMLIEQALGAHLDPDELSPEQEGTIIALEESEELGDFLVDNPPSSIPTKDHFKASLALLRTTALTYKKFFGAQGLQRVREHFLIELMLELDRKFVPTPSEYFSLLSEEGTSLYLEALPRPDISSSLKKSLAQMGVEITKERIKQKIMGGVPKEVAGRIVELEAAEKAAIMEESSEEALAEEQIALKNLTAEFPDPRTFIDRLLNLKKGKLVVR